MDWGGGDLDHPNGGHECRGSPVDTSQLGSGRVYRLEYPHTPPSWRKYQEEMEGRNRVFASYCFLRLKCGSHHIVGEADSARIPKASVRNLSPAAAAAAPRALVRRLVICFQKPVPYAWLWHKWNPGFPIRGTPRPEEWGFA